MEFENLDSQFLDRLYKFLDRCQQNNIVLSFDKGFVHPKEQAGMWKQSRSDSTIDAKIAELEVNEAFYISQLIKEVSRKPGIHLTDDLPGYSWHNWGQAYTFTILGEDGRDLPINSRMYTTVAEIAKALSLTSGWNLRPKQPTLLQLSGVKNPAQEYSLQEINKEMERMYGNNK